MILLVLVMVAFFNHRKTPRIKLICVWSFVLRTMGSCRMVIMVVVMEVGAAKPWNTGMNESVMVRGSVTVRIGKQESSRRAQVLFPTRW